MFGFQTYWEPIVISADALIVYLLYKAYRSRVKEADVLVDTPTHDVGASLRAAIEVSPEKSFDYVCIQGVTKATGEPLKSQFTGEVGVIQHQLLIEHRSKRTNGSWSDFTRIVRDFFNYCPFHIVSRDSDSTGDHSVEISDVLAADYLSDHLPVVHDSYSPVKDNLLSKGMDLLFGEVTKGYQDKERFLPVGAPFLGVGRLTLEGTQLILQPPADGRRYILTTLGKPDVVRSMRSNARTLKVLLWIFAILGSGVACYSIYKFVTRWLAERDSRRTAEEIRRMTEARSSGGASDTGSSAQDESTRCIVCIENRRDVVILNCGHVCVCYSCAVALPEPKLCPICRSRVLRFVPVFVS